MKAPKVDRRSSANCGPSPSRPKPVARRYRNAAARPPMATLP